jgi:hypothetical protein
MLAICNYNPLLKSLSENFTLGMLERDNLTDYFTRPVLPNFNIAMQFGKFSAGIHANYFLKYQNQSIKFKLGYSLEEMLISCSYNMAPCNSSDFEWFYDVFYGKEALMKLT